MRRDEARPPLVQRLFAERHIYLRSGPESRYVVVSSALQAGVSLIALFALVVLGVALYSSVDKHLEAAEQSRRLAQLEGVNKSLLAAAEATRPVGEAEPSAELVTRLEQAEAARARAEDLADAASAERDEVRRELDLAEARVDEALTQLAALQAERDALMAQLNAQNAPAAQAESGDDSALRAEVADLTVERTTLEAELERVREEARANVAELEAAEEEMAALRNRLEQTSQAKADEVEQLEVRIATLQAENEQLTQAIDEIQSESHELQTRLQEAEASGQADGPPATDPAEVERLRDQLAEAEARLAEMEQAILQVEPAAGPESDESGGSDAEQQRLREELEAARARIAELEQAAESSRAGLQRRPSVGDSVLASDFEQGENGVPDLAPAPAYQTALEAVTALRAELAAADQLVGLVAEREDQASEESIRDLKAQIESAGERIRNLDETLDRLKERDVALQKALVTLAPLPPPPAPR